MRRSTLLAILGVVVCAAACHADEFRVRFVNPLGAEVNVLPPGFGYVEPAPNGRARVRLQLGVFDDENGPARAGGIVGWAAGSISVSGFFTTPMDVIRTPGRLAPFRFAAGMSANGTPTADPFTAITSIDNTLGTQVISWPAGSDPKTPPPPVIRGLNTFASVYEVTLILPEFSFKEQRTLTVHGLLIGATEWRPLIQVPPTDTEAGMVEYFPVVTLSESFTIQQSMLVARLWHCEVDFDGNFVVNSQDFFEFLTWFFLRDPIADVSADGVVNSQDFFAFIEAFVVGCG